MSFRRHLVLNAPYYDMVVHLPRSMHLPPGMDPVIVHKPDYPSAQASNERGPAFIHELPGWNERGRMCSLVGTSNIICGPIFLAPLTKKYNRGLWKYRVLAL